MNVTDAAALENAGDGMRFTATVRVFENGTGLASEPVSFVIRVEDVDHRLNVPTLVGLNISEQQGLDAVTDAARGILLESVFAYTEVQPDYDDFFPGTQVRLADVAAAIRPVTFERQEFGARLHNEELFGLFVLEPNESERGLRLRLGEGRLVEQNLLGEALNLNLELRDPTDPAAALPGRAASLKAAVDLLPPSAPEELEFAIGSGEKRRPAAYELFWAQSPYGEELAASACAGENATTVRIDARCYATRLLAGPTGDLSAVMRRSENQRYLTERGRAPVALVDADGRSVGFRFTEASGNVTAWNVRRLTADGRLGDAEAYFNDYFTLEFNASYDTAAGGEPVPAMVLKPKFYQLRNTSAGAAGDAVLAGSEYPALDTLPLDFNRQEETLSYFIEVFNGDTGSDARRNASRRALGQINIRVMAAGLNERAFLSSLSLGDVPLSNKSMTVLNENHFQAAVNNLTDILRFTAVNPDAAAEGQRTEITLEVIANARNEQSESQLDLQTGMLPAVS